jgi:hypothetical protein
MAVSAAAAQRARRCASGRCCRCPLPAHHCARNGGDKRPLQPSWTRRAAARELALPLGPTPSMGWGRVGWGARGAAARAPPVVGDVHKGGNPDVRARQDEPNAGERRGERRSRDGRGRGLQNPGGRAQRERAEHRLRAGAAGSAGLGPGGRRLLGAPRRGPGGGGAAARGAAARGQPHLQEAGGQASRGKARVPHFSGSLDYAC